MCMSRDADQVAKMYNGGRRRNSGVSRKKSVKRSTRKHSFGVRSKIKRNVSISVKQRNIERAATNRNNGVRDQRSKSFIVKRKSFKKPRKWSSYIKCDGEVTNKEEEGNLPRVKGFWKNQKYIQSRFYSWGKIWTEQWRRRKDDSITDIWRCGVREEGATVIPRPTLLVRR